MVLLLEWLLLFVGFPILAYLELWPVSIFLIFAVPVLCALLVSFFSPREPLLRTNRLTLVWLEHSIYGLAIFTSGLGSFFYQPVVGSP